MKIDKKQICGVVVALSVVACVLVYLMVFTKYNDETASLKKKNDTLQTEVKELKGYYDDMDKYIQGKEDIQVGIAEMTADYPSDAKEEDILMMAVNMQEAATLNYKKINVEATKNLHLIPEATVKAVGDEELKSEIAFDGKRATYDLETDYVNLKNAITEVYSSPYRIGVNAVSFKKDSDDNNIIKGSIDISYYSVRGMEGKGITYEYPEMSEYVPGGSETDLFGIRNLIIGELPNNDTDDDRLE